jgi:phosphatidylserine synthase
MNDEKKEQIKSTTPVPRWKRWHFRSRIILMVLGAIAVVVYLVSAGLAKQYEGLGAALCVIACGGFLIWHAIHLFAEQDAFDEQQLGQSPPSSPELSPSTKKQI